MIKVVRAWQDSQGVFHHTHEAACKAEFARLLAKRFDEQLQAAHDRLQPGLSLGDIAEAMFDIDKMIGEATKEDTRVEYAGAAVNKPQRKPKPSRPGRKG